MEEAWLMASVHQHASLTIRSGHLLLALVTVDALAGWPTRRQKMFEKISPESLRAGFDSITGAICRSCGYQPGARRQNRTIRPAEIPTVRLRHSISTIDLTARAKAGEIDPVLGRDSEVDRLWISRADDDRTIPS